MGNSETNLRVLGPLAQCIGALALLMLLALLGGCAAPLPHVDRTPSGKLKADGDTTLGAAERAAALPQGVSGFRPMAQGAVSLDARVALIENARVSIDFQTYLLGNDKTGRLFLRLLRDAAQRGVRVRVLLDDFYTKGMDPLLMGLAAYPNADVRLFNPFVGNRSNAFGRTLDLLQDFRRLNHRMHNKLLIVDGSMAVVGGRNSADEYFFRSSEANFVDFDLLITGDIIDHLGELFDMYWNSEQVYPVASVARPGPTAQELRRSFDADVSAAPRPEPAPVSDLFGMPPVSVALAEHRLAFVAAPASAHADSPLKASLTQSGSALAMDTVRSRAMALLPQTKSELVMFSPYFIPGDAGLDQFRQLRQRGVEVKVITNSLPTSDEPLVNVGYEHYRLPLLQMGVEVYELSSSRLGRVSSLRRVLGQTKGQLHAKMGFIDREIVLVGSMNMDPRSANINTELGILVRSPELAKMILDVYQIDNLQGVYQVRLKPDGQTVFWSSMGEHGEETVEEEPDSNTWDRVLLYFQHLFVSDDLL